MPKTSTAVNPHGVSITFTEETHKYESMIDGKPIDYVSVTELINSFFPVFDQEKIAPLSARKHGVTVEEILEKWKKSGEEACSLGTKIHETCEDIIRGNPLRNTPLNDREKRMMDIAIKSAENFRNSLEIIDAEMLVFNEEIGIAGTIDLLAKSKKNGNILILDWKTNKRIIKENDFGKYGLGPLSGLADNNYNHYSLQLSIYQWLLVNTGYVDRKSKFNRALIHLSEHQAVPIIVPYLGKETEDIIEIFKNKHKRG